MKTAFLFGCLIMCCCFALGCGLSKDAEVEAFIIDFEKVTNEMIAKIDNNPSAKGVDEAQKVLDDKKADLKTRFVGVRDTTGIQMSAETKKKFEESMMRISEKIVSEKISKLAKEGDATTKAKIQKLVTDYTDIIKMN